MENNSAACTASAGPSERRNRDMIWIHTNANDGSSAGNSCKHDKSIKNNNNATNDDKSNDDGNDNGNNYLCNNDPPMEQPDDCTDPSNNSNNNKVNDDPSSNSLTQGVGFTALTPFRHTLIPSFSTLAEEDNSTLSSNSLDHARSALFTSPSSSPSATPSSLIAHQHRLSSSSSYPLSHSTFSSSLSEDVAILSKMLLPLTGSGNSTSTTTSTTTGAIATAVSTDNKDQQQDDPETALLCVHKDEEQSPSPSSTLSACTQVSLLSGQRGEQAALDNNRMLLMSMSKTGMAGTMSSHHADQDVQDPANPPPSAPSAPSISSSGCPSPFASLSSSSDLSSPSCPLTGQHTLISGDNNNTNVIIDPTASTRSTTYIDTPTGPSGSSKITSGNIVAPRAKNYKTRRLPFLSLPPPPALPPPPQSVHSTKTTTTNTSTTSPASTSKKTKKCPTHPAASSFVQVPNLVVAHATTPPPVAQESMSSSSSFTTSSSSSSSPRLESIHPLDPSTLSVDFSLYPSPPLSDSSLPPSPPLCGSSSVVINPTASFSSTPTASSLAAPIHPFDLPPPAATSTPRTATETPTLTTETRASSSHSWLLHPFRKLKITNNTPTTFSSVSAANISSVSFISSNSIEAPAPITSALPPLSISLPLRSSSFKQRFRSFSFSNDNTTTTTTDSSSSPSSDTGFLKRMVELARNHTMPVVPSGRRNSTSSTNLLNNTSRCNTTSFAGATITLPKTLSNKSLDGYGHLVSDLPNLNSRTRSSSSAASGTSGTTGTTTTTTLTQGTSTIPLAPIIAAIHRGNFLALSEPILDVLIRSMAGKNSTALETINITGAAISASDAKLLARLIRSSDAANIKVLQLARNAISQQAIKYIFEAWKYNQTITTISLSRSGMNDKTVKYVSKMLAKNETLQELDLSSNRITATGMELLAEGLVYNRALTRLCLQSNNIKRAGAPFLARLLTKNRVLRHLNVGSNGLGTEGCSLIADAVRFNRTLNSLSLDMNEMGPKGATAMATALVSNRHLTYLYLPHNNIGDQGLVEICESLKRNRSLIGLDLELNNIGSAQSLVGMTALGDILKTNKSLREINLAYNLFSGDAIGELMKGVAVNSTLESINFTNCGISTEGALAIAEVLPSARGLQNLGLTSNPDIAVEGYWALSNNLAKNRSMKGIQLDYNSEDRHVLYEAIQHMLTRNFIWQQAIYTAACRILVLSRVVLLGRPANQRLLQTQIQQQQLSSQSKGAWSLLKKKVGLSRTNSTNSYSSLLTINKHHANHEGHPVGSVSPLLLAVGSMSRATAVGAGSQDEREAGSGSIQNLPHGNRPTTPVSLGVPSLSLDVELGPLSRSNSSSNIRRDLHPLVLPHQQQQLMDQGLLLGSGGNVGFIDNGPGLGRPSSTRSISSSQLFYQAVVGEEYNAHKVLANLANMPYEIFETICAYLDPGHTMTISQIRMTIQVAGDRSTIAASGGYYTKDKMLEKIFLSRYISPFGMRYSVKNGDERL